VVAVKARRSVAAQSTEDPSPGFREHDRTESDGTLDNVKNFVDCMRTRKSSNANLHVGSEATRTSWIGNTTLKHGGKVIWDAAKGGVA
jgi:hypothetical protein